MNPAPNNPEPITPPGSANKKAGWILLSIAAGLSVPLGLWFANNPSGFLRRIGFNDHAFSFPAAWLMALAITVGYIAYTFKAVPFVAQHKFDVSWLKLIGLWTAVATGLMEEIAFRMLLMDWAQSLGGSAFLQVALSAVTFGVAHATWVLLKGERKIALPVVLSTGTLGALLGLLYLMAGRNLLPCILTHTAINLVIEPWLILAAVSGQMARRTDAGRA